MSQEQNTNDHFLIEIESQDDMNTTYRGDKGRKKVIPMATETFSQAIDKVLPIANIIADKATKQQDKATEVTVEFGLKVGGETDLIIASASVEANFKVTISWKK